MMRGSIGWCLILSEDNNQIFDRYMTVLPSKEELKKALEIDGV